jgi:peptidoglycan/LPS O-acetylase OafA/YrhL
MTAVGQPSTRARSMVSSGFRADIQGLRAISVVLVVLVLVLVVLVFAVASFAACLEVSAVAQPLAFFSLPTCAWGFSVGGWSFSSCPSSALPWSR